MTNNCTCDPRNVTRTTLESHIGNTTVHVTSEDHTKINKVPELESSVSGIASRVSALETAITDPVDLSGYVTNKDLKALDYVTKASVSTIVAADIDSKLDDYYTKSQTDDEISEAISNIDVESSYPEITVSTNNNSRFVSIDGSVSGTKSKPVVNINISDKGSAILVNEVSYVNIYTTTDTINEPTIDRKNTNPGSNWSQSIDKDGVYLWSSRGMKDVNGKRITFADGAYWTDPQFCGAVNDTTSDTGVDTDIFNYIYWLTASETGGTTKPAFSVEDAKTAFDKNQSITDKSGTTVRMWNDHPSGVTSTLQYEYCSFAKYDYSTGKWGEYSIPFIFSHYGIDGRDGDGVEYVYKLSQLESTPVIQFDNTSPTYQEDDYIPDGWNDDPQSMYDPYLYQYCSVRKKNNGVWGDFSTPVLWSVYKKPDDPVDTESTLSLYKGGAKNASMITEDERKSNEIPEGWITTFPEVGKDTYVYTIVARTINGKVSLNDDSYYWSIPIRITSADGEKGEPGTSATGSDGSDIDFVYCRTTNNTRPTTPTFTVDRINKEGSITEGGYTWTDNPRGVTQDIMHEWISVNTKPAGINTSWAGYTTPVLWSKYGERGTDGDTIEYIYKRTSTDTAPDTPVAPIKDSKLDDNFPADWTDNPSGVNLEKPYEWVSLRKKDGLSGEWGVYTDPKLWSKYGKDGKDGKDGTSAQGYSLDCDNPHVIVDDDTITLFGTAANATYTLTDTTNVSGLYKFEVVVDSSLSGVTCKNTNSEYSSAKTTTLVYTATEKIPVGDYVTVVTVKKKDESSGTETTIATLKQHIVVKDFSLGDAYKLNQQTYTLYATYDGKLKDTTTIKASYTKMTNNGSSLSDCKYRTADDNKIYFLLYPESSDIALSTDTIAEGTSLSNYYVIKLYLVTDSGIDIVDEGIIGVSKDGEQGATGDKGDNAVYLKATPDTLAFAADNNGMHLNDSSSQTVDLVLYNGGTPIKYTNYTLEYRTADHQTWESDYEKCNNGDITIDDALESSDDITTSITLSIDSSNWPNDNAWSEYRATYNGNKYVARVNWIGHRMGEPGKSGLPGTNGKNGAQIVYNIRKFSDCVTDAKFKDGTQDEVPCVLDVVIDDSGNYYKCIKAYTLIDKSTQGPTNTTYWEKFETFTNIATDLVLAKKAYIQNLLLNYATAVNRTTNTTTISIDGDTGILTANGLQARNATVSGSIEANTIGYSINTPQAVTYKQPTEDNATWIPATLPNGSGTQCAAQVLACNSSVYVMPQVLISSESDVDDVWEAWSGNCVTYVILPPTKVGKIALDIYFRNEITDWDGYNTDTVYYLAVMNPTISKSYIEDGAYAKSVISNLTSYYPSLVDLQSAGSTRRVTTKNYIILTEKYNNGDIVTCDRPSHIKLMSDGTNWYIVQVDEFDK